VWGQDDDTCGGELEHGPDNTPYRVVPDRKPVNPDCKGDKSFLNLDDGLHYCLRKKPSNNGKCHQLKCRLRPRASQAGRYVNHGPNHNVQYGVNDNQDGISMHQSGEYNDQDGILSRQDGEENNDQDGILSRQDGEEYNDLDENEPRPIQMPEPGDNPYAYLCRNRNRQFSAANEKASVTTKNYTIEVLVPYDGYKMIVAKPNSVKQRRYLAEQRDRVHEMDDEEAAENMIIIAPQEADQYLKDLKEQGIEYVIMIDDLKVPIDNEKIPAAPSDGSRQFKFRHRVEKFLEYHTLKDIYSYLDHLKKKYRFVTVETIGKSYEGKNLRVVKICKKRCGCGCRVKKGKRNAFWVDGGMHGREWISISVALYLIARLVRDDTYMTKEFDWYIMPVVNPDGYEYSRICNRLWKNTKSMVPNQDNCLGADINRNFDYQWVGYTGDCAHFPGHRPYSEPETTAIMCFIQHKDRRKKMAVFNTLHSFGQLIQPPWSYSGRPPFENTYTRKMLQSGADEIKNHTGKIYKVESEFQRGHIVFGSAVDWARGRLKIALSMKTRLGKKGYFTPTSEIRPTGVDIFEFHQELARILQLQWYQRRQ